MLTLGGWLTIAAAILLLALLGSFATWLRQRSLARRLPARYLPEVRFARRTALYCGLLAWLPMSFVVNGTVGFVMGLAVIPAAVIVPLRLERRGIEAIVADVRAKADSMERTELEQLLADLESAYGPLRQLRGLAPAG